MIGSKLYAVGLSKFGKITLFSILEFPTIPLKIESFIGKINLLINSNNMEDNTLMNKLKSWIYDFAPDNRKY